jgi:hypothetical protein
MPLRHLAAFPLLPCLLATAGLAQSAWRLLPGPGGYATKRLAYDDARGRMVMIESSADAGVFRTWERVGDQWSLRHTPMTPPPRDNFAAAYDPLRQRVVLVGGNVLFQPTAPGAFLADTWEYDGVTWTQRILPTAPPQMRDACLAFDHANGKLLLYGAFTVTFTPYCGLYDGASWTQVAAPPPAYETALASDPVHNQVIATSGFTAPGYQQTAIWNGTAWTVVAPPLLPPSRESASLVFDTALGEAVLLGGYTQNGPCTDRWGWDGAMWHQLTGAPTPPRIGGAFAHDPTRNLTLGVGGMADISWLSRFAETLQWDGATWTSTGETFQPFEVAACFDVQAGRVVAYDSAGFGAEWDGRTWSARASVPGSGSSVAVGCDVARQRLVAVRGGFVQEWTGAGWTTPVPVPFPPSPSVSTLIYHQGRQRVMAAASGSGLWEWDGVAWILADPSPGSIDGGGRNIVYDPATNSVLTCGPGMQTSTWDGTTWTSHPNASVPPLRQGPTLGFDPVAQRVVLFGGWVPSTVPPVQFDDLWEWDGSNWSLRLTTTRPSPRADAALVVAPDLGRLVLVSGHARQFNGAASVFGDLWALEAPAGDAVVLGNGCGGANGAPTFLASSPTPNTLAFTLEVTHAAPSAPAFFGFAGSAAAIPLGAGCTLWLQPPVPLLPVATNASGQALLALPIPPALAGLSFATQAAVLDGSARLGVALSRGLLLTIGW